MRNELITVMIPLYNVDDYLATCIESVLVQTYTNLEILLVDDGSTDDSARICDEYASKDSRIQVIHKKNEGQSVARNLCIDIAKGEYLIFVDSDDYITPDYIEVLYNLIKKYNCKVAVSVLQTFQEGKEPVMPDYRYEEKCLSPSKAVELMNYQEKFDTWPVCKLYHKSIFASGLRYPNGLIFEDFAITYLLLFESDKVAYCNKPTYFYLLRAGSTEGEKFSKKKMEGAMNVIKSFESHMDLIAPIIKSYKCRMVSFAFHLLLKMPDGYEQRDVLMNIIKDYRWSVIFDVNARTKAKIACLISLFGFKAVKLTFSLVDRRKY